MPGIVLGAGYTKKNEGCNLWPPRISDSNMISARTTKVHGWSRFDLFLSFCGLWVEAEISQPQIFFVEEEREGRS